MTSEKVFKLIRLTFVTALVIGILLIIFKSILLFSAFGIFDKYYKPDELIGEFNYKSTEINSLKSYFKTITPLHKQVDIELKDDEIARLVISPIDTGRGSDLTVLFQDWNIPIKSAKTDSLLAVLRWNRSDLEKLQDKLDEANCISIASGEPAKIGFKRSGMGIYFFNVFDKPIPDSLKTRYNDSCTYVYANKKLVLEFGGGAIGSQCFFNKQANR